MEWIKKNAGQVIYAIVCMISIWFIYWFAAVYH